MVTGRPPMALNMPSKSLRCMGSSFSRALRRWASVFGNDHFPHGSDAVCLKEHVLCTAQADALRAKVDRLSRASWGVSALVLTFRLADRVGPAHEGGEVACHICGFTVLRSLHRIRCLWNRPMEM